MPVPIWQGWGKCYSTERRNYKLSFLLLWVILLQSLTVERLGFVLQEGLPLLPSGFGIPEKFEVTDFCLVVLQYL